MFVLNITKFSKNLIVSAIAAGALSISAGIASAATLTFSGLTTADLNAMTPIANISPTSTTPVYLDNIVGNQYNGSGDIISRSPWEGSIHEATGMFSSVQAGGSVTFTFTDVQYGIDLIWGSPDSYNDLTITLTGAGGTHVVNGSNVQGPVGILASMVSVTDVFFKTVTFESSSNAFEFANLTTSTVPLPAGMLMMGTAIAGFGVMRRRRKS